MAADPTSLTAVVAVADVARRARIGEALIESGFEVEEAADAAAALAALDRLRPEVLLMDIGLPGGGVATIAQAAIRAPKTAVVAFAGAARPSEMIAVLQQGAQGYLTHDIGDQELAIALVSARKGEPALSRALVPHLIAHVRRGPASRLLLSAGAVALTPRESDVAELIALGSATSEVAARLGLSPVTVRRHVSSLLRKTGMSTRASLAEALRGFVR
ncbi:MAG: response regulator transcription factor [Actinomycetota bacterium]